MQHCWTFAPGVYVASVAVRAPPQLPREHVVTRAHALIGPYIRHLTVQVES